MNTLIKAAGLLLGLSLLGACASLPSKAGPEDCLIVIKTESSLDEDIRDYTFVLSEDSKQVSFSADNGKVGFVIKHPGVKITKIKSWISGSQRSRYRGDDSEEEVEIPLPYKAGSVLVVNKIFFTYVQFIDRLNTSSGYMWRPFKADEKEKFIASLKKLKNFELWEL